jgi:hypothetical protein
MFMLCTSLIANLEVLRSSYYDIILFRKLHISDLQAWNENGDSDAYQTATLLFYVD